MGVLILVCALAVADLPVPIFPARPPARSANWLPVPQFADAPSPAPAVPVGTPVFDLDTGEVWRAWELPSDPLVVPQPAGGCPGGVCPLVSGVKATPKTDATTERPRRGWFRQRR